MNKTIIININGIVFHIEEDAYEILKSYMTEVKRHFAYSTDSEEIVTDIENRLAEMFSERLSEQNKQVIVLADVEDITAQMGKAQEFELPGDDEHFASPNIKASKSLYRDADEKLIGGVCAGLAHYFDVEIKYVRLIVLLLTVFSGVPLIPYFILWIILPTAKTRQEKMAMKGEALNLHNFKKSFDEEVQTSKPLNTDYNQPYRPVNYNDPIKEIITFTGRILKAIVKILVGITIAIGSLILFALIVVLLFGLGFIDHSEFQQFPFNAINSELISPVFLSGFLILIIPLLALVLFALRVLLNRKVVSRYGAFAMLILWITGLGMGVYYGSKIAADFREEARFEQVSEFQPHSYLTLKLNSKLFFTSEDSTKYNIGSGRIAGKVIYGENNLDEEMRQLDIYIDKSDDGKITLVKELSGRGRNFEQALKAAQRINYQVLQQDSTISFDKYFSLSGKGLYRAQEIDLHLKIPVNTRLRIDGHLNDHIRRHDLWDCRPEDSDWQTPTEWIMTNDGLKCVNDNLDTPN